MFANYLAESDVEELNNHNWSL